MSYVFNGDFVDRGAHSLEVIGLLLALKVSMPNRIWLVRGNHEDRSPRAEPTFPLKPQGWFVPKKAFGMFWRQSMLVVLPHSSQVSGF